MATSEDWKTFDEKTILSGTEFNNLHNILDQLRRITGLSSSTSTGSTNGSTGNYSQCLYVEVIHTFMYAEIDVTILGEDKCLLSDLERRLREELYMCYFIMNENPRTCLDQKISFDTRWHPDIQPNLPSDLMELKRRIVWLTCELNFYQDDMLLMARNNDIDYFEPDDVVTVNSAPCDMYHTSDGVVHAPHRILPLMRPLASDCTPNITFETFTLIREFVFIEKDMMDPALRFQLVQRLDAQQMDRLLINPYDFFFDIVRCMGMSAQEFIDACFKYDKDGKPTGSTRCPCGAQLGVTDGGIRSHGRCCQFSQMVHERCPSILRQSLYSSCHEVRAMGWKEKQYIIDVMVKRLSQDEWQDTFLEDIGVRIGN